MKRRFIFPPQSVSITTSMCPLFYSGLLGWLFGNLWRWDRLLMSTSTHLRWLPTWKMATELHSPSIALMSCKYNLIIYHNSFLKSTNAHNIYTHLYTHIHPAAGLFCTPTLYIQSLESSSDSSTILLSFIAEQLLIGAHHIDAVMCASGCISVSVSGALLRETVQFSFYGLLQQF